MARTQQTARRSTGGKAPQRVTQANGIVVDDPDIDENEAKKLHEIEEGEMRALLKHIDRKFTDKGAIFYTETKEEVIAEQVNWWSKFALCLVRYMDQSKMCVQKISLQVNSQHLKDILKSIIERFPGVSFQTKEITIDAPYRVLFHYKNELEDTGKKLVGEAKEHLDLLLDFIDEQFHDTMEESENLLEQGLISYSLLWIIFRPHTTEVYSPVYGQHRAYTLTSYAYSCNPAGLSTETLTDLPACPLKYHPTPGGLREQLIERGRRFEKLAGMSVHCYNGIAFEQTPCGMSRYNIEGRVVVDTKTFHRLEADYAFSVAALKSREDKRRKQRHVHDDDAVGETREMSLDLVPKDELDIDPLTEEQCMRANALVRGFSFAEKRWLDFFVDKLSDPAWNTDCFEQLVLPQTQKDLVQALVANHVKQRNDFDDIVKGKGKGLIMVFHGPPGIGKTLTAENRDLGTNSSTLDARLTRILDMASTWKAVLLIDEADVFLERRSLHDMERNSLVSIFLRVLEYYEGILFLTSNRVNTFDDAFKSRAHVPLKYNDLTVDSRKQIWKNFLSKMETGVHVDEAGYKSLTQAEINGRQIKNVVRTAKSLAQFHKEKLSREKLEQVIQIQMEFEHELGADSKRLVNGHVVNGAIDGH
ncbi:hypothetical protein DOTSEDRAFT_88541 [Dothistroma septosporum NZE10]|uniref:Uncharacterized protein n=1 Tax=Dothistroma septosporum (strain NZE10 / CBS 128990) TaxID=675120 RepID=N1PPQ5_DOTSN|nr:hypothetical protein DOTSEDRAFT_88541 [Dothistroma septosporum NZE10]